MSAADVTLRLVLGSTLVLTIAAVATMATTMTLVGLAGGLSVLLGMVLGRQLRRPKPPAAAGPETASPRRTPAMWTRFRRLLGTSFSALWLASLRSTLAARPPAANPAAPETPFASERRN